jgi:TRAP-type C4-dicarboxylate transport system substrate-binding protein
MSKSRFDALTRADQELFLVKARESVGVMRALWDEKQATARQTVLDAGIAYNEADRDAFRRAVEPMKQRWLANEDIAAAVRRIDAHE